jgi:subtilisin family serine protease
MAQNQHQPATHRSSRRTVSTWLDPGRVGREHVVQVFGDDTSPVLVELNLQHPLVGQELRHAFLDVFERALPGLAGQRRPVPIAGRYFRCVLDPAQIAALLAADQETDSRAPKDTIFRIWPDYLLHAHIDRSMATVKADAAGRTYLASGEGVTWAVLDTGVAADHPHFGDRTGFHNLYDAAVVNLHRDFTYLAAKDGEPDQHGDPLIDPVGHGTHVAGIIAGRLPDGVRPTIGSCPPADHGNGRSDDLPAGYTARALAPGCVLGGVAPRARLVSLRVLLPDDTATQTAYTVSSAVIEALHYIRTEANGDGALLRIHGVNLSLGCPWYPSDYACGQSPLCRAVDELVASGVVVVVSAGNNGYAHDLVPGAESGDPRGVLATITDPGNAADAITVGSTHRDSPHVYGVSYTSSKGPTLDGRLKPDLVAPGERITSCATGGLLSRMAAVTGRDPGANPPAYIDESGTSMAAPHVSGAIAAFLSARNEYMGRPDEIKKIFCSTATSLGRDPFFEGHGLLDLMRAFASV